MKKLILNIIWLIRVIPKHIKKYSKKTDNNKISLLARFIFYIIFSNKNILSHSKVKIYGIKNIEINGLLEIGVYTNEFLHPKDKTLLNIQGKLRFAGSYSIGRGSRIFVAKEGVIEIGKGGHITAFTNFIIRHKLVIGDNCAISWNCQFLDDDRQSIDYIGRKEKAKEIIIGNHVWIGSGVQMYQGTVIPDGCVVASNSVVRGIFDKENSIIGGVPARIIKENISWK